MFFKIIFFTKKFTTKNFFNIHKNFVDCEIIFFIFHTQNVSQHKKFFLNTQHLQQFNLDVALVYNVKHEAHSMQTAYVDEEADPPSTNGITAHTITSTNSRLNDTYAEWDEIETIHAIESALATRHNVSLIEANENVFEELRTQQPQIVFNIAEGLHGVSREAQIPSMLEFFNIPYTGSDPLTLAICLDKARTKEILSFYKIPNAPFFVIEEISQLKNSHFDLPLFVKPLREGSSKGIYNSCVVRNEKDLTNEVEKILSTYEQPVLVEKYLSGKEFTVAMLGNGKNVRVLPIVEINFDSLPENVNRIYSYEAKWIWDTIDNPLEIYECPAKISSSLQKEIERICLQTFNVLRIRDWCRIDVRLDEQNIPNIIEINPLPGILPNPLDNSCFPKSARTAGISYDEMLCTVLDVACARYGIV